MTVSGNCKEQVEETAYVHAHQQQQQLTNAIITAATTAATQNSSEIIMSRHNNSGEDMINQMIYPYRCQISDNLMVKEEHASPPIKHRTGSPREHHSAASAVSNVSTYPPFYNNTSTNASSFSASYNTLQAQQHSLSQQISTSIHSALTTSINNSSSKKIVFTTNFHADINTPPTTAELVDSNGRPITTKAIDFTRPYKKYKNLTIVDNEDYMSSSSSDLLQQQRQQSPLELPKRYICAVCGKKFVRPSSLTTHTYSHTGEKPYKCTICGRQFSVVSNLRRHGKVHSTNTTLSESPTMN